MNRMWKFATVLSLSFSAALIFMGAGFGPELTSNKLVLRSPNGKNTITISADNDTSGIWIDRGSEYPLVSIFNGKDTGCAVGVYKQTKKNVKGCDVAIGVDKDGGIIQMLEGSRISFYD